MENIYFNNEIILSKKTKKTLAIISLGCLLVSGLKYQKNDLKEENVINQTVTVEEQEKQPNQIDTYEKQEDKKDLNWHIEKINLEESEEYDDPEILYVYRITDENGKTEDYVFYKWMFEETKKDEDEDKKPSLTHHYDEEKIKEDFETKPTCDYIRDDYEEDFKTKDIDDKILKLEY